MVARGYSDRYTAQSRSPLIDVASLFAMVFTAGSMASLLFFVPLWGPQLTLRRIAGNAAIETGSYSIADGMILVAMLAVAIGSDISIRFVDGHASCIIALVQMHEIHVSERREGPLAENRNADIRLSQLRIVNFIRCNPVYDPLLRIRRLPWQGRSHCLLVCDIWGTGPFNWLALPDSANLP